MTQLGDLSEPRPWSAAVVPAAIGWATARLLVAASYLLAVLIDRTWSFGERSRLRDGLLAWDGGWYRSIAETGYHAGGEDLRFSPLFPLAGKVVGTLLGGNAWLGLVVVANVAGLGAAVLLIRYGDLVLDRRQTNDGDRRRTALAISFALALWPASFVLVMAYAESLLLVLTAGAALLARRQRWLLVIPLALASGFVRPTGMALAILLAGIAWQQWQGQQRGSHRLAAFGAVVAPILGFAGHLLVARLAGAGWREPITIQGPLRGSFVDPLTRAFRGFGDITGDESLGDGLHLPFAILVVLLVVLVAREIGWPEATYAALVIGVALSADNWNSLERYALSSFPIFVALGLFLARQRLAWLVGVASGMAMMAMTVLAWSGDYVP